MPSEWFKKLMLYRNMGYNPTQAARLASGKSNKAISKKGLTALFVLLIVIGGGIALIVFAGPSISEMLEDTSRPSHQGLPPEPDVIIGGNEPPEPVSPPQPLPAPSEPEAIPIVAPTITKITQTQYWDYVSSTIAVIRIEYLATDPTKTADSEINVYLSVSGYLSDPVAVAPVKTEKVDSYIDLAIQSVTGEITAFTVHLTLKVGNRVSALSQGQVVQVEKTSANPQGSSLAVISTTMGIHLLSWDAVPGAYYNVYRSDKAFTTQTQATMIKTTTATQYTDQVILNGIYYYAVVSVGTGGKESGISNVVSITFDMPGQPDPALEAFVRKDESASYHPFSYAVFTGKASSAQSYPFKTDPYTGGNYMSEFLITENELKTWLNVPSLYTGSGDPVVFYGKHSFASQYMWIIKIGTKWYVAQYGASNLDGVAYGLKDLVKTTSGGFILPAGVAEPRSYLLSVPHVTFDFQLLFAFLRLFTFFMLWK